MPAPRLTARSMLSLGTELDFAFAIASASVGLPAGSPPPVRDATSTFLISFANSLPRRASTTAFLCLVVAHLLCPLIWAHSWTALFRGLAHHLDEQCVHTRIAGQLGVKRRREQGSLTNRDDSRADPRERLDVRPGLLDPRRADEHPVDGPARNAGDV